MQQKLPYSPTAVTIDISTYSTGSVNLLSAISEKDSENSYFLFELCFLFSGMTAFFRSFAPFDKNVLKMETDAIENPASYAFS